MLQKKPRIQPMSWSLTTLLLAACGGGGGGGPTVHSRDGANASLASNAPPPVDVIFVKGAGSSLSGPIAENSQRFNTKSAASEAVNAQSDSVDFTIPKVAWVNAQKATVTFTFTANTGQQVTVPIEVYLSGPDARQLEFVSFSADGKTVMQFKSNPDYERPLDANGDNIYSFTVIARYGSNTVTRDYELHVTDTNDGSTNVPSPAGRSSVPAHEREGDKIEIEILEGNTDVFLINTDRFSPVDQTLATGPDADKFEIEIVNVQGQRQTIIKFKEAPDFEAPGDADNNNVYNFEFDGSAEAIYGNLSFEVTVIDNPNEIL